MIIDSEIKIAKIFNEHLVKIVKNSIIFTEKESATITENSLSEVKMAF